MNTDRLVRGPSVTITWQSTVDWIVIHDWAHHQGIDTRSSTTPIGSLVARLGRGGNLDDLVEFAGRQCYRSWSSGRAPFEYIDNILSSGHGSVLEHAVVSFAIAGVSRSLSHELVRHRAGFAYSQESQRYVDAKDMRFVIPPAYLDHRELEEIFLLDCTNDLERYVWWQEKAREIVKGGKKEVNQAARWKLPNAAETRLVATLNLRAMRHFFETRGALAADPEIRRLAIAMYDVARPLAPLTFHDFKSYEYTDMEKHLECQYHKV